MYPQGDQLMLRCLSEGGPQLEYSWIFSGGEIATTPNLTINNVNASNGGDYTCNVTNEAGFESDIITVYSKLLMLNTNRLMTELNTMVCYQVIFQPIEHSPIW